MNRNTTPSIKDSELVVRIQTGDTGAFHALYQRYAEPLFHFVWRRTRHKELAEDLVQESFTRLWSNRTAMDEKQSVKAWLYQVAQNLTVDHLRRKVRETDEPPMDQETGEAIDDTAFEKREHIRKALADLPGSQRQVFVLSRYEGLKYSEIAETMEISVKTVETHMSRALKKLRASLQHLMVWFLLVFFI